MLEVVLLDDTILVDAVLDVGAVDIWLALDIVTDSSYPAMSFFSASMISIRFEVLARCK